MTAILYRCPLCQHPLNKEGKSYRCQKGHCFDIAKEAYVNLIPVQNKKSQFPGDNANMMAARKRFLNQGHYHNFRYFLQRTIQAYCTPVNLLDIGCGEAYYSQHISELFSATLHGIDISKPAIKLAAKRFKTGNFSVASAFNLPFFDARFDTALSILVGIYLLQAQVLTIYAHWLNLYMMKLSLIPIHLHFRQQLHSHMKQHLTTKKISP